MSKRVIGFVAFVVLFVTVSGAMALMGNGQEPHYAFPEPLPMGFLGLGLIGTAGFVRKVLNTTEEDGPKVFGNDE